MWACPRTRSAAGTSGCPPRRSSTDRNLNDFGPSLATRAQAHARGDLGGSGRLRRARRRPFRHRPPPGQRRQGRHQAAAGTCARRRSVRRGPARARSDPLRRRRLWSPGHQGQAGQALRRPLGARAGLPGLPRPAAGRGRWPRGRGSPRPHDAGHQRLHHPADRRSGVRAGRRPRRADAGQGRRLQGRHLEHPPLPRPRGRASAPAPAVCGPSAAALRRRAPASSSACSTPASGPSRSPSPAPSWTATPPGRSTCTGRATTST